MPDKSPHQKACKSYGLRGAGNLVKVARNTRKASSEKKQWYQSDLQNFRIKQGQS